MFDRRDALHLFEFDRWANERIARTLAALVPPLPEAERLWAHIVGAEELWITRVEGGDYAQLPVWPKDVTLDEIGARFVVVAGRWRAHLERADAAELAREVRFANSRGECCADPLEAIARHVVNHGEHHRAQIATQLRARGTTPENLDYIHWRRTTATAAGPSVGGTRGARMRHFVIEVTYLVPLSRIDAELAAHRAHLATGYADGSLLASGPQEPRTGGMILARALERADIDAFLARDPFALAGLARYRVIEFDPIRHQPWLADWLRGTDLEAVATALRR